MDIDGLELYTNLECTIRTHTVETLDGTSQGTDLLNSQD